MKLIDAEVNQYQDVDQSALFKKKQQKKNQNKWAESQSELRLSPTRQDKKDEIQS